MIPPLSSPDRFLLHFAERIVPEEDRPDWLRCWRAELWHRRRPRAGSTRSATDLYPGLLRDALWLRTECWRRALAGTAVLCLLTLSTFVFLAVLPLVAYFGDLHLTYRFLLGELPRFCFEATLTSVVSFATASRATEHIAPHAHGVRLRAYLFEIAKLVLLQILAYLLSMDLTQPFHPAHRFATEVLQPQLCTFFAVLALRWSFEDQDTRCRHCLRSLSAPLRVGRPSWNFIDSNGTHLACPDGHGLLSVPEIETSWRRSSEWIAHSGNALTIRC